MECFMFATNLVEAVKSIPFAVSCSQDGFIRERAGSAFAKGCQNLIETAAA